MDPSEKCDYINFVSIGNGAWWKVILQGGLRQPGFLRTCLPHPSLATPAWLPPASVPGSFSFPRAAPRSCLCPNPPCPYSCSQLSQVLLFAVPAAGKDSGYLPSCPWLLRASVLYLACGFCKARASIPLTNLAEMSATDSKVTKEYNRPRWADRWAVLFCFFPKLCENFSGSN